MNEIGLEYLVILETALLIVGFLAVLFSFLGLTKNLILACIVAFAIAHQAWGITNALFAFGIMTTLCALIYRETNISFKISSNSHEKVVHDKIRMGLWIGLICFVIITLTFKTFTGTTILY